MLIGRPVRRALPIHEQVGDRRHLDQRGRGAGLIEVPVLFFKVQFLFHMGMLSLPACRRRINAGNRLFAPPAYHTKCANCVSYYK